MDMFITKDELLNLKYMIPVTGDDGGNYTELHFDESKHYLPNKLIKKKCSTVLQHLARLTFFDMDAFRKEYGETFNRKNGLPIVLHPSVALIPVKIRDASYKDQGTIGYINSCMIKNIFNSGNNYTTTLFFDETSYRFNQSAFTVSQQKDRATMIRYHNYENLFTTTH